MRAAPTKSKRNRPADNAGLVSDLISQQNLRPGQRLPSIREIAARFHVKTGAVRDALIAAQSQGLINVLPRLGAIVQSPNHSPAGPASVHSLARSLPGELREILPESDQNLFHVLDAREELELATIARASRRRELPDLFKLRQLLEAMTTLPVTEESPEFVELDIQFHLEIARLSGNGVMTALLGLLLRELKPHLLRIRWSIERRQETNASHARIYSALVAADVEQAQREVRDHLRTAFNSLLVEMLHPPKMNGHSG
jgi:GntR family transcriptional repressor for pyruvate dehydrogenase complex